MPKFINREKEKHTTNKGYIVEIIKYFNNNNCTIQFEDGTTKEKVNYAQIKRGNIEKPYNRTGERYTTHQGYEVEIIEYFGALNCTILFDDSNKTILYNQQFSNIRKKSLLNPYHPSVYGIGYIGVGKYKSKCSDKITITYDVWRGTIRRSYDKNHKEKYLTYINCSVVEEWHNFQNFAEWFEENYNPEIMKGWHLDKDILFKGNKIYSPETCCFVPQEINKLFIRSEKTRGQYPLGVKSKGKYFEARLNINGKAKHLGSFNTPEEAFKTYKTAKEQYIKEVADKWKDKIELRVYEAMYNYKVEITD